MKKKIIFFISLSSLLFSAEYKYDCQIPNKLIEAIKITENANQNPFLIRTNEQSTVEKFYSIASKYEHKKTKDTLVVNCKSEENCVRMSRDMISSGITNIDLGLYQINYNSYPYNTVVYFNDVHSYRAACKVVIDKIRAQKKWSWETLAAYHSATPSLNKIYKDKLIANYIKLSKKLEKE